MEYPPLQTPSGITTTTEEQASILRDQFSSVFTREGSSPVPNIFPSPHKDMPKISIDTKGVLKLLKNLKNKAQGPDEVTTGILKLTADQIAEPLAKLFQQSLDEGILPDDWCRANITPIFKKGKRQKPENYRPVSLTSICCKLLEHIICKQTLKHLDIHNILTNRQHGFRSGHSCESQLIITANDLAKSMNDKVQTDMAILDFSKAFDKVPHTRLLAKLDYYGIRSNLLRWAKCFLTKRSQRVVLDGVASTWDQVLSGVPQGMHCTRSTLLPTLYQRHP